MTDSDTFYTPDKTLYQKFLQYLWGQPAPAVIYPSFNLRSLTVRLMALYIQLALAAGALYAAGRLTLFFFEALELDRIFRISKLEPAVLEQAGITLFIICALYLVLRLGRQLAEAACSGFSVQPAGAGRLRINSLRWKLTGLLFHRTIRRLDKENGLRIRLDRFDQTWRQRLAGTATMRLRCGESFLVLADTPHYTYIMTLCD